MACTSGCKTQDHASYGECLRANLPTVRNSSQSVDPMYQKNLLNTAEITEYRAARAQGIQPKSTKLADIRAAVAHSKITDSAQTHY